MDRASCRFLVLLGLLVFPALAVGQGPDDPLDPLADPGPPPANRADPVEELLGQQSAATLSATLRNFLLASLPPVLYADDRQWGKVKYVTRGYEWKGKLLPEKQKAHKYDGVWRRIKVTARQPQQTLTLHLRNLRQPAPGTVHFTLFISLLTGIEYDQQRWHNGTRLWAGTIRARLRVKLALACEVTTRVENNGGLIPDLIFHIRVLKSAVGYDDLVVEHFGGVGGDLAKVLGEGFQGMVRLFKPSLERDLLVRGNAALVKAADHRQVRLSLMRLAIKK